jgi:glyoxylase-like metal-dependent hydrolase (beta-lactamase superfamily II)
MLVRQIADSKLAQFAYLIGCPSTGEAIVIDPERDVDRYFELAVRHRLRIVAAADTHIHADYVSGLREMADPNSSMSGCSPATIRTGCSAMKTSSRWGSSNSRRFTRQGIHLSI